MKQLLAETQEKFLEKEQELELAEASNKDQDQMIQQLNKKTDFYQNMDAKLVKLQNQYDTEI